MLKFRILTAVILIPITLMALFYLSAPVFAIVTGLILLACAFEWSNFMGLTKPLSRILYLIITALFFIWALFIPIMSIFVVAFFWWLVALLLIIRYPSNSESWSKSIVIRGIMGILVLLPCWAAINFIRNEKDGIYALLFLFVLIWGADSFAYLVGKKWGKHQLAKAVSPGKTWQGLIGAILASILITIVALWITGVPVAIWLWAIGLSLVTVLFSVVGDLFESMMKRQVGLKDSGKLLPGHGGLLDRLDSLTAASPIFVLGGFLLGKYLG